MTNTVSNAASNAASTQDNIEIWGKTDSGNCYKIRLLMAQLQQEYRWHEVNTLEGESRTSDFLKKNPNGKVPLLQLGKDRYLAESNAILCYLADSSPLFNGDRWRRARILQWLFFEQYSHEPAIAVARFICKFLPADHSRRAGLPALLEQGNAALAVMDQHLAKHRYFADDYSIADIGLYAYTHVAPDAGFDLSQYPAIESWMECVSAQAGYLSMADFQ